MNLDVAFESKFKTETQIIKSVLEKPSYKRSKEENEKVTEIIAKIEFF